MKQHIEEMRYKVPKVKNRFIQTHIKLILICAMVAAVLILLAFSYALIHQSYILEPKTTVLLFCEVENYEETQNRLSKYEDLFKIVFVKYEVEFDEEDGYDFSGFGSRISEKYATPSNSVLAVVIPPISLPTEFSFGDVELSSGATLDANTVDDVISFIRSSL